MKTLHFIYSDPEHRAKFNELVSTGKEYYCCISINYNNETSKADEIAQYYGAKCTNLPVIIISNDKSSESFYGTNALNFRVN